MLAVDLGNLDNRDVECPAAQIEDRDRPVTAFLSETIGQGGCGRLVDDSFDLEARDSARILRRLALRVIKIGRYRDDRFRHALTEVVFRALFHLREHSRGDLGWRHLTRSDLDPRVTIVRTDNVVRHHLDVLLHDIIFKTPADQALDSGQGIGRIRDGLPLSGLSDQYLFVLGESNDGGSRSITLAVLDHFGVVAIHHGDTGVRRT